jgi:hypothetical protein
MMILLEREKLVIVTPPHTGSGALHRILCKADVGGIWVNGPNPDGGIDHHYGAIHQGWTHDGYSVILLIREPYARKYGLYKHYIWWLENQGLTAAHVPYEKYLDKPPGHFMHQETQQQFYQRNSLEGCKIVTTAEIDDVLAFEYDIDILPEFDHTALFSNEKPVEHPYFKTDDWTAEVNFWKYSGSI